LTTALGLVKFSAFGKTSGFSVAAVSFDSVYRASFLKKNKTSPYSSPIRSNGTICNTPATEDFTDRLRTTKPPYPYKATEQYVTLR